MTTFNKSDLLDQKKAGKHYYFFVIENHPAIIMLEKFDYEFLTNEKELKR